LIRQFVIYNFFFNKKSNRRNVLESLVEQSKIFEKLKKNSKKYLEEVNLAVKRLETIVSKKCENLINIFRLDSEEGEQDFELTILRAFLNCKI